MEKMVMMKYVRIVLIICYASIVSGQGKIPQYIRQCRQSDPRLIDCLKNSLHHLKPYLAQGIPEIERCLGGSQIEYPQRKSGSSFDGERLAKFRAVCAIEKFDAARLRAFDSYLVDTQKNLIADPSKFWAYVNETRKTVDGTGSSSMQEKCDLLAKFFSGVFVNDDG
ncbi:hypothetical protein Bhyg_06066 [Pseudolycoriella hygida]|uniref:Uncharacterized protein n=1 Tax=Pseudolycoriella hygida TaxID=35572 RepID=A0A9Q0N0R8_9DIPT|nr:hypothetical protein Bhyg_06066 [Pseudolycoriella hygida]